MLKVVQNASTSNTTSTSKNIAPCTSVIRGERKNLIALPQVSHN
jgi:hypothetical protein